MEEEIKKLREEIAELRKEVANLKLQPKQENHYHYTYWGYPNYLQSYPITLTEGWGCKISACDFTQNDPTITGINSY